MPKTGTSLFESFDAIGRVMVIFAMAVDAMFIPVFISDGEWLFAALGFAGDLAALYAFFIYVPHTPSKPRPRGSHPAGGAK